MELLQVVSLLFYSTSLKRDLRISLVAPLAPLYHAMLLVCRVAANTRELFWRTSFRDNFVPRHVRQATWKW